MGEADAQAAVSFFPRTYIAHGVDQQRRCVSRLWTVHRNRARAARDPDCCTRHRHCEPCSIRIAIPPSRPTIIAHVYEKILVERTALGASGLPGIVLRLPKVYGPATMPISRRFTLSATIRDGDGLMVTWRMSLPRLSWRRLHPAAVGQIYNVGEEPRRRCASGWPSFPSRSVPTSTDSKFNFDQDIAYDTSRIRRELGFEEVVGEDDAMRMTVGGSR